MSEPTPPDKLVFRSNMQTASQQPKDYFAEQNQQHAEEAKKLSKTRKKMIWIGVAIIIILAGLITALAIIMSKNNSGPVVSDDATEDDSTTVTSSLAGVDKLTEQINEVYNPTYFIENGEMKIDGDMEAVEATYRATLSNPANKDRLDTVRLSQIVFYSSIMQYQRVVEIAAEVTPSALNLSERLRFYNLTYLAYSELGDKEQANRYYQLTREIASQVEGVVGE